MKKILFAIIIFVFCLGLTSCKKCKEQEENTYQYIGVYLQVSKNVKERKLNDVNYKAYINERGGISTVNNSFEYRITSNQFGPTRKEEGDYVVNDFGISCSIFVNNENDQLDKVEIFPIVFNEENEIIVLDKKVGTIELVNQEVKGTTIEKSYEYEGQKYYLKVSVKITKKIVG